MQVTVENVSELSHRTTITVDDANIEQTISERLNIMRPKLKMAGFRPGKVPLKMVQQLHGPTVRQEVIDNIVQTSMQEAFAQEGITPASPPHIEGMNEQGATFTYSMTYEVFPEIKEINLNDMRVDRIAADVNDVDVDTMLQTLREQRAIWEPLTRNAEKGDGVTIDFTGSIDGEEFEGGNGTDILVVIGNGNMLPEFENQLIGVKTDEEKTITTTFPDDYRVEHLKSKQATFVIQVKAVAKKKLPVLDKQFAKACGVEGDVDDLAIEVRTNMVRELKTAVKACNKYNVMNALAEHNNVGLPEVPVQREAEHLLQQAKDNLTGQGVNVDKVSLIADNFKDTARRNVLINLLVGKIVTDNEISVDDKRVKDMINVIAANYEDFDKVVNFYMNDEQKLSEIQTMVVEDTVVEWVLDRINVEEKSLTFSEVMSAAKR